MKQIEQTNIGVSLEELYSYVHNVYLPHTQLRVNAFVSKTVKLLHFFKDKKVMFTKDEEALLKRLVDGGWNIKELAHMMNRTPEDITSRLCKLASDRMDNGMSLDAAYNSIHKLVSKDTIRKHVRTE